MSLEQLKKRVEEINKSTAISHPKVMIAALCSVIQELISHIEHLKKPKITLTSPTQVPCIPTKSPEEQEDGPIEIPGPSEGWRDPQTQETQNNVSSS